MQTAAGLGVAPVFQHHLVGGGAPATECGLQYVEAPIEAASNDERGFGVANVVRVALRDDANGQ